MVSSKDFGLGLIIFPKVGNWERGSYVMELPRSCGCRSVFLPSRFMSFDLLPSSHSLCPVMRADTADAAHGCGSPRAAISPFSPVCLSTAQSSCVAMHTKQLLHHVVLGRCGACGLICRGGWEGGALGRGRRRRVYCRSSCCPPLLISDANAFPSQQRRSTHAHAPRA